jgi:hypothetical protein
MMEWTVGLAVGFIVCAMIGGYVIGRWTEWLR